MWVFGLVEGLGLNAQASEDRVSWLFQAIITQTDLNGGGAVLQSDHMSRGILTVGLVSITSPPLATWVPRKP